MISAVDLLPTLLDAAELKHPKGIDGRSFSPLLRGQPQQDRNYVFKVYNENSGGGRHPMKVFTEFRGREPDPAVLLRHYGLVPPS